MDFSQQHAVFIKFFPAQVAGTESVVTGFDHLVVLHLLVRAVQNFKRWGIFLHRCQLQDFVFFGVVVIIRWGVGIEGFRVFEEVENLNNLVTSLGAALGESPFHPLAQKDVLLFLFGLALGVFFGVFSGLFLLFSDYHLAGCAERGLTLERIVSMR